MKQLIFIVAALALLCCTASAQIDHRADSLNTLAKGFLAKRDLKQGLEPLRQAAELGQPEAQFNLGVLCREGVGVKKSDSLALLWFRRSAEQGFVDAQYTLGQSYLKGTGTPVDPLQGFLWMEKAAKQNDPEAMFIVSGLCKEGIGTAKDPALARSWKELIAKLPNPPDLRKSGFITSARYELAMMYLNGTDGVKANPQESYKWFLIGNEKKQDLSILNQQQEVDRVKDLQAKLTMPQRVQARKKAETFLGHNLTNLAKLLVVEE